MDRRHEILKAIINHFIETAEPVGSETIVVSYHFEISPATVRSEMTQLEHEGFLLQPHTSAGRIPTEQGYRLYVDEMADYITARREAERALEKLLKSFELKKAREKIYDAVWLLSQGTENVSFATLPDNDRTFYLGVSNVLRQPEFMRDPLRASQVVEVLEDNDRFVTTLRNLPVSPNEVKIFIGKENILKPIQSCSMVLSRYDMQGYRGFLGLLGPTRTRYAFNHAMVEKIKELVEKN